MSALVTDITAIGITTPKPISGNYTLAIKGLADAVLYAEFRWDGGEWFRSKTSLEEDVLKDTEYQSGVEIQLNCVDMGAATSIGIVIKTQNDT